MSFAIALLFFIVLEAIALYCAVLAVRNARTPQGSVAWVFFLVFVPFIAVPVFLFLGNFKFESYLTGRRDERRADESAGTRRHRGGGFERKCGRRRHLLGAGGGRCGCGGDTRTVFTLKMVAYVGFAPVANAPMPKPALIIPHGNFSRCRNSTIRADRVTG